MGPLSFSRCSASFTRIHVLSDASSRSVAFRPRDFFILRRTCRVTIQPETVAAITAANTYNVSIASNIVRSLVSLLRLLLLSFYGTRTSQLVCRHKYRFDVCWKALQSFQRFLHFRTQQHHLTHQLLGTGVIARGF